jgi:hypothetical protein
MSISSVGTVSAYILADVVRSLLAEAMYSLAPDRKPIISVTLVVLLVEVCKLFAAFVIVLATTKNFGPRDLRHFAIPAGLYFANNCLYFWILADASAGGMSLLMHVRLPLTALARHFLVEKQKSWQAWTSLAFVFVGVSLAQMNEDFALGDARVLLVAFMLCLNSSVASVLNERTLKTLSMPFWDQQLRMYFFGTLSSFVGVFATTMRGKALMNSAQFGSWGDDRAAAAALLSSAACVVSGAAAGILTGVVIYRLDNVVKVVSNSIITLVVTLASYALFGIFPFVPLNFVVGGLIVVSGSYAYAVSIQKPGGHNALPARRELKVSKKRATSEVLDKDSFERIGTSPDSGAL